MLQHYPTVSETAIEPPQEEGNHINSPEKLSLEAMFINASFSQQVLRQKTPIRTNRYRKWDLGNNIVMLCRCEHDGIMQDANNEKHFLTIRAFNEWDSRCCGGLEWTSKMDSQRGAVLATELKNNSCKLARWTMQAYLAGSDYIKFGYVSRAHVKDSSSHVILSTQQFRPAEFAAQINLNVDNAFGVLRVIVDLCMKQPAGQIFGVVRLYKIPSDSFESDIDEEDVGEDDDDDETEN
uniref:Eukaryotic translation initiation factor 3 subunit p66 n=1 Tax=Romanomermis culicivorax TaxID=13658 RepID=A0A915J3A0_ROMCU